jgi:hypothetical protein
LQALPHSATLCSALTSWPLSVLPPPLPPPPLQVNCVESPLVYNASSANIEGTLYCGYYQAKCAGAPLGPMAGRAVEGPGQGPRQVLWCCLLWAPPR